MRLLDHRGPKEWLHWLAHEVTVCPPQPESAPSVLFVFCDGAKCAPHISANTTSLQLEQHLLFLFDTNGYCLTKCFFPPSTVVAVTSSCCGEPLWKKSADRASMLWISLLLLWFNTNIIFCGQMADASLTPRAGLHPFKTQHMYFTTVKRLCKGE